MQFSFTEGNRKDSYFKLLAKNGIGAMIVDNKEVENVIKCL